MHQNIRLEKRLSFLIKIPNCDIICCGLKICQRTRKDSRKSVFEKCDSCDNIKPLNAGDFNVFFFELGLHEKGFLRPIKGERKFGHEAMKKGEQKSLFKEISLSSFVFHNLQVFFACHKCEEHFWKKVLWRPTAKSKKMYVCPFLGSVFEGSHFSVLIWLEAIHLNENGVIWARDVISNGLWGCPKCVDWVFNGSS